MKINNRKKQDGFTGIDLTVALIVVLVFVSLITSLYYNVYINATSTKRNSEANSYSVNIFSQVDKLNYDDVNQEMLIDFVNAMDSQTRVSATTDETKPLSTPYRIYISVVNYKDLPENEGKNLEDLVKQITITIKYNVGKKEQSKQYSGIKKREVEFTDSLGIKPELGDSMTPVKWVNDKEVETTTNDPEWFDYSRQKWANVKIVDQNGNVSYFVWIPRYEYKLTYKDSTKTELGGTIDIKFIKANQTAADDGYMIHPVFRDDKSNNYENGGWDRELPGFWMSKYEASRSDATATEVGTSDILKSVPGVKSCTNIKNGDIYNLAYHYNRNLESHLTKNTEWGACAYLAHSKYGRNEIEVSINQCNSYITGGGPGLGDNDIFNSDYYYNASSFNTTYGYTTQQGQKASTTGNSYGIYDMNGGVSEFVAAYYNKGPLSNGSSFATIDGKSTKYVNAYSDVNIQKSYKLGDATNETKGWNGDIHEYFTAANAFMCRGGSATETAINGLFRYSLANGNGTVFIGFRMCLVK